MRATIDGVRYDTKSPRTVLVAEGSSNCGMSDFRWYQEGLYRTGRGRWFLAGEGHAMSKYACEDGGGMHGPGRDIIPLSDEQAREWLESENETEALDKYFADQIETDADAPDYAAELRSIREALKLTQAQLAERIGVDPNTVARWERGEIAISEPVIRLARLIAAR